jgi:hypothetical protein
VLRRLKGNSPERFLLFGRGISPVDPATRPAELGHWVDEAGRVEPVANVREAPPQGRSMSTSCDPPDLQPALGRTYLVFREADGRLLGQLAFHRDSRPTEAFPIADVGLFADSSWGRQVYQSSFDTAAPPNEAAEAAAGAAADEAHGTVTLRKPITAEAAEALARRAGAVPLSVTVARGSSRADYGFGAELASIGLFADALAWAGRSGTPPEAVRELARQLATTYTAYDFETDGAKIANANDILALAREGEGRPGVTAFVYRGGGEVRRRLQAEPLVASVGLAVQVRGRIGPAGQPVPPEEARPFPNSLQAADLHRRLAALAGLEVADAVLAGTWQLVDVDALPVAAGTLILRLGGGKMSGTLACSRFEGGYELKGQVLVFNTVKPSVAACAKAPTTWLGEGFFENPVATVRSTGSELILSRGNAIYRFVRA